MPPRFPLHTLAFLLLGLPATLAMGCGGGGSSSGGLGSPVPVGSPTAVGTTHGRNNIDHVVIIVQENRSFNNLFMGYPGAETASSGPTHFGTTVKLVPVSLAASYDIGHNLNDFLLAYDGGKMDGFDLESKGSGGSGPGQYAMYAYAPRVEVQPYWNLASHYVLSDRMFASQIDSSFTAHQYLIAGQAGNTVNAPTHLPWGCDAQSGTVVRTLTPNRRVGPGVFPCFHYPTMADRLDEKHISWRYYAPSVSGGDVGGELWSAYEAISDVRFGPDWLEHVVSPESQILSDVAAGQLAAVTWVVPDYKNSDHALSRSTTGPQWVASVVNAIGKSPLWAHTAILVTWDDWGGWYDSASPPYVDNDGLGMRVPLLVISPYAKQNYVSHVQYEFGSILKFAEYTFRLKPLAASDTRASALDDCFDFTQTARPFEAIATQRSPFDFQRAIPSGHAPDDD